MANSIDFATVRSEELPTLIAMLDSEFVFGKGRRMSLAQRFPTVFGSANLKNIYVARSRATIVAATAVRRFRWSCRGRVREGAMLGAVYTRTGYRGKGIATGLLRSLQDDLQQAGVDFAVLWTNQPALYRRLGWFAQDCGIFGEAASETACSVDAIIPSPLDTVNIRWVNALYRQRSTEYVVRSETDYGNTPLPATTVELFTTNENGELRGYGLVGSTGDTGYVYELIGTPSAFGAIWRGIRSRYRTVYINDRQGSPSSAWLTETGEVKWSCQRHTMWLPLSRAGRTADVGNWYIPYYDRI